MTSPISYSIRIYKSKKCRGTLTITEDQVSFRIESVQDFYTSYKRLIVVILIFSWLIFPLLFLMLLYNNYLCETGACKSKNTNFIIKMSEISSVEAKDSILLRKHLLIKKNNGKKHLVFFFSQTGHIDASEEINRFLLN